jgi:hypothetical protein
VTGSYDKLTGILAAASLETKSLLTPRCTRRLSHTVTTTITTTMRVIYGVHNDTADAWALTLESVTACFTDLDVLVLFVTQGTDAGSTFNIYAADFA